METVREYQAGDIKALRRKLNLSQVSFAATLGVSQKAVSAWEQGLRTPGFQSYKKLLKLEQEEKG